MSNEKRDKDRTPEASRKEEPGVVVSPLSRRRFTKAGLAAPVLMSLASRPVWGRECTASAMASFAMNQSVPIDLSTCDGCSPGYWNHPNACWDATGFVRTQTFADAFGYDLIGGTFTQDELDLLNSMLQDLFPEGNGSMLRKVFRAALSAALSAAHPLVPVNLTVNDVVMKLHFEVLAPNGSTRAPTTALGPVKEFFESFYDPQDINCPLPNNGNCP